MYAMNFPLQVSQVDSASMTIHSEFIAGVAIMSLSALGVVLAVTCIASIVTKFKTQTISTFEESTDYTGNSLMRHFN